MFSSGKFLSPITIAGLPVPGLVAAEAAGMSTAADANEPTSSVAAPAAKLRRGGKGGVGVQGEVGRSDLRAIPLKVDRNYKVLPIMASTTAADLEFRNVSKRYPGQREPAIPDLTLHVPAGEICVLVGPSGSGKTTALRLVNRMIEPTGGDILLGGQSVLDRGQNDLRKEIGYVIQQIGLFPHLTIAENVATVPRLLGWDKARIASRVSELFELIGLDEKDVGDRYPVQLSGGKRRRVGVAGALAADPPLMLMDE